MTAATRTTATRQAQDYLAAVEHELADLPAEDRNALLEDLAPHLEALTAEDDDRPVAVRLGPPAQYAADLRAAAGLPARGVTRRPAVPGIRARIDRLVASDSFQRAQPALTEIRRLLVELRPAWWVLRGYLLVLVLNLLDGEGAEDVPVPAPFGSHVLGLLLVAAAVAGSVGLGRRMLAGTSFRQPVRTLVTGGGVLLVLVSWVAWQGSASGDEPVYGYDVASSAPEQATGQYPLLSRYGPVTDVFPYAADGTPLEGVLLYDQDGRPLETGFQEWWADGCRRVLEQPPAADGVPVPNSFPQNYRLPGPHVDLYGAPLPPPGQCLAELPRPEVPLPVFPPAAVAPTDAVPTG